MSQFLASGGNFLAQCDGTIQQQQQQFSTVFHGFLFSAAIGTYENFGASRWLSTEGIVAVGTPLVNTQVPNPSMAPVQFLGSFQAGDEEGAGAVKEFALRSGSMWQKFAYPLVLNSDSTSDVWVAGGAKVQQ